MPRALFRPKAEAGRKGLGLPVNPNLSPVTRDYPRALPRTSSPRREPPRAANIVVQFETGPIKRRDAFCPFPTTQSVHQSAGWCF
jgi:hypothetical protein